ncbi:hypothetical protein [Streptomyces odonnellii]|uniref:hypothetical protein n=1 Tax=Streptomyces odonnellii TaxID=1417980 RepID=UPI000A74224E|nr:hypothetical protein [Streptomyces odonnellii]
MSSLKDHSDDKEAPDLMFLQIRGFFCLRGRRVGLYAGDSQDLATRPPDLH